MILFTPHLRFVLYICTSEQSKQCIYANDSKSLFDVTLINMKQFQKIRDRCAGLVVLRGQDKFGAGASCLLLGPPGSNWCFSFAPELVGYSAPRDLHRRAAYSICESLFLIHQDVYHDLFLFVCS